MFDPALLKSFLAVAECRSFTEASRKLGLRQSTVSQHVQRLELTVGRRLFTRDTHSVTLTEDGEAMRGFASSILEASERALRYFTAGRVRGRLRFGASEDLVLCWLPIVLASFLAEHPLVDLELTVALSRTLIEKLEAGELDLAFCKRPPGSNRGILVWHDRVVWTGAIATPPAPDEPVPLVLYPPPSLTRTMALEALERSGRSWRIACTSSTLTGLTVAAAARFGLMAHASRLIPPGLHEIPFSGVLPELGDVEFALIGGSAVMSGPVRALSQAILMRNAMVEAQRAETDLPG